MDPEQVLSLATSGSIHESQDLDEMTLTSNLTQPTFNHDLLSVNSSSNMVTSPSSMMMIEEEEDEILGYASYEPDSSSAYESKETSTATHHSSNNPAKLYKSSGLQVKEATISDVQDRAQHHLFAQKATEWLSIREFDTTTECIHTLREEQYTIWATDLSQVAIPLTQEDLMMHMHTSSSSSPPQMIPDKLAIVFGTESVGCTQEILQKSDLRVYLPLYGYADSLNLSVAVALVLHQLFTLDPSLHGAMPEEERVHLRRKWYTKLAKQRILTSSQKQQMKRLVSKIQKLERLQAKVETESTKYTIQQRESILMGLGELDDLRLKLQTLQYELDVMSRQSIEDLVLHPPEPLDDMRRADEHRITYISKNMRRKNEDVWADMPAIQYVNTTSQDKSSCSLFRSRVLMDTTSLDTILK